MTTTADDRKKNAANTLEVLGPFRDCFQQWSNLLSVRRRTVGWSWDLENNDPPGVPDLGLRDRLASLGAKLLPDLNGLMGEPAISQGALEEIVWLCERSRDKHLQESPQEGKYYGPAFDVLEADLRSLSGVASPVTDPDVDPPSDGPAPPNLLIWKGTRHELPPRHWRLLDFMWERDEVPLQELEARVWDCEVICGSTVNATVSKLNANLVLIGCPVTLSIKSGYITKT